MSKTVCVYHSIDLDGWMSAAIVKHYYKSNSKRYLEGNIEDISDHDSIAFIGYNYGQPIPDLSEYEKVIMCDISFPKEEMIKLHQSKTAIKGYLGEGREKQPSDFIWVDHHISAINDMAVYAKPIFGYRDIEFAACELTWKYFFPNKTIPEIVRLLGRYDCFGNKGTDEYKKVLEFQYGARSVISNYKEAFDWLATSVYFYGNHSLTPENEIYNYGIGIYGYLCTEAKQIYEKGFKIALDNPKWDTVDSYPGMPLKLKFICINRERFNPINFGIDYHKEGYDGVASFFFDGKCYNFSLYNDNGLVDCSEIAKTFGGGGHKGAAGFILDKKQFEILIN